MNRHFIVFLVITMMVTEGISNEERLTNPTVMANFSTSSGNFELALEIGILLLILWTVVILIVPVTILSVIFFRLLYIRLRNAPASTTATPLSQARFAPPAANAHPRTHLELPASTIDTGAENAGDNYLQVLPDSDDDLYV